MSFIAVMLMSFMLNAVFDFDNPSSLSFTQADIPQPAFENGVKADIKDVTLMVFMNAKNDLSESHLFGLVGKWAKKDIDEMKRVGSSQRVNVVEETIERMIEVSCGQSGNLAYTENFNCCLQFYTMRPPMFKLLKGENIEVEPISLLISYNYVLNDIRIDDMDLKLEEGKLFTNLKNDSSNYVSSLIIKYSNSYDKVLLSNLNKELFANEKLRKLIEFVDGKINNKDGFPSHMCWNECKKMCDGVYNICHLFCFHCCQTEGSSPLCH